jgi:hypothetical protein
MAVATTTALTLAAIGASAGTQAYGAKKAASAAEKARQLSPLGQRAAGSMEQQAGMLNKTGTGLMQQGAGYTGQGMNDLTRVAGYYSPMLSGSRGALDQALAPETAAITDAFRGGEKALQRSNIQGAQRDMAQADLIRDRAGQIGLLRPQARAFAAQSMADIGRTRVGAGLDTTQTGAGLMGQAGGLYGDIYRGERGSGDSAYAADAAYRGRENEAFGRGMGSLMYNVIGGFGQGKGAPLPTTGRPPIYAGYPTAPPINRPYY